MMNDIEWYLEAFKALSADEFIEIMKAVSEPTHDELISEILAKN